MANCQNNMRYGRMRTMQPQSWQGNNCMMKENEVCGRVVSEKKQCSENYNGDREKNVKRESTCSCQIDSMFMNQEVCKDSLEQMSLAMAYVPWQKWNDIYEICKGFQRGTIFAKLDKPFWGRGGCNR